MRTSVVFPDPLGPRTVSVEPAASSKETSRRATRSPYERPRDVARTAAGGASAGSPAALWTLAISLPTPAILPAAVRDHRGGAVKWRRLAGNRREGYEARRDFR